MDATAGADGCDDAALSERAGPSAGPVTVALEVLFHTLKHGELEGSERQVASSQGGIAAPKGERIGPKLGQSLHGSVAPSGAGVNHLGILLDNFGRSQDRARHKLADRGGNGVDDGLRQQMGGMRGQSRVVGRQESLDALVCGEKCSCFRLSECRHIFAFFVGGKKYRREEWLL